MKAKAVLGYASGTAIGALLTFLTIPVLAWMLPQELVGKLIMLQVLTSLVVVIFSLGLDQSYVREFHESLDKAALQKTVLIPGLVLLLALLPILIPFHKQLTLFAFEQTGTMLTVLVFTSIVVLYFERFLSVFIRMQELPKVFFISKVLPKLFFLAALSVAYFGFQSITFEDIMALQVLSWTLGIVLMAVAISTELRGVLNSTLNRLNLKAMLYFGLPLVINGVAFWGLNFADRIMLAKLSSFSEVGLYAVAAGFAGVAMLVQQIFAVIWHPTVYKWAALGIDDKKIRSVSVVLELVSMFIICFVGVFAWMLPMVLPVEYQSVQFFIAALVIPPLVLMMSEVSGVGINVARKTKYMPLIALLSLLINIILNGLLIPKMGAAGAAIATLASTLIFLTLKTEVSFRVWRQTARGKMYILVTCLASAAVLHCSQLLPELMTVIWLSLLLIFVFVYRKDLLSFRALLSQGI